MNPVHNATINQNYDHKMYRPVIQEFYEGTDFYNFGFWYPDTKSLQKACENLMEELLAFIPVKKGKILDVACGKGATTRYLTHYYNPANIVGINVSEKQLKTCHESGGGCRFFKMDASNLAFNDRSFDAVISVEAAFHFKTREKFFREAYRVLVNGGYLVLSDILFNEWAETLSPVLVRENHVKTLADYKALLERSGFRNIMIHKVTEPTWRAFVRHLVRALGYKLYSGQMGLPGFKLVMYDLLWRKLPAIRGYILVGARKP
jgi:MPBQ/MSBQ methyltransferase